MLVLEPVVSEGFILPMMFKKKLSPKRISLGFICREALKLPRQHEYHYQTVLWDKWMGINDLIIIRVSESAWIQ